MGLNWIKSETPDLIIHIEGGAYSLSSFHDAIFEHLNCMRKFVFGFSSIFENSRLYCCVGKGRGWFGTGKFLILK